MDIFNGDFSDTRIPGALINDENKLLEENVEAKLKEIGSIQINIDEHNDRIQMLEDHQTIVQDEIGIIQRLLAARRTEETTERSHTNIDSTELQRIERLIGVLDDDLIRFNKRKSDFQTEIDQLHNESEKIDNEILIEKETLEKFIDSMKKRDDEAFCLMKYTRQDDIRIKELTIQLEKFSEKSIKLKRANEEEIIEYSSHQVELDKIAETFRRSHTQRQQLIKRWETILLQMQRKDYDIDRLSTELIEIKGKARMKEQELNEQKLFYEHEQKNNLVIEKLIDLAKQKIIRLKAKQKIYNEKQEYSEKDVLPLKTALINTQNQIQRERTLLNELKTNITRKHQELIKLKQRREQILDRKRIILHEKLSSDEKLSKFENLMKNEQKYQNTLNNQTKKYSENLFLINNEILSLRKRERQYEFDIQGYRNQIHTIKIQTDKLDQQLLKQQELIYHQDFLKQTVDRRINRLLGEKTNEKYSQTEFKIHELKTEYEKKKSHYEQLQNQIKILHEELRITKRDFDELNQEKNVFNEKFIQFDLYINLTEKHIQKLNNEKEDYLIEENLLNIELKRLKNLFHNSSEINSNLEQQQIEIQKAIKERRIEVQANSHLFRIRFNDERTKKATISTELAMRITKIDKLKNRYESLAVTLNPNKTDDDHIKIQAQYVIKTAQMKESLLKQGDQLEGLIIKAEKELRALENTVQILKWNNIDVKKNFEKLNEFSPEVYEMEELEEHLRAVTEQVKIRRKLLKDLTENKHSESPIQYEKEIEELNTTITNKRHIQSKLEDEIEQFHVKIHRADRLVKRLHSTSQYTEQDELDIDIRLQRETNKKIEQQIISLCSALNNDDVINILSDQGINLKSKPKRQQNKSSSSLTFIPNLINISIDSNTSESSSKKSV